MRRIIRVFAILWISIASNFASEPDFGKFDGTAVIIDLNTSAKTIYGTHADERVNPCSTFKILNSMIALDSGAVRDENETLKWDGVVRRYPLWNQDHSMRSAISVSAVWFYQELARRVGSERMARMVAQAHYGNADTSRTLTDFWLGGGSLLVSANEEAEFVRLWMHEELPFSTRAMRTVKEILILEKKSDFTFGGKTGSCGGIGWFVGFVEKGDDTKAFAFEIRGEGASGAEAKKIASEYYLEEH
ncbi:MAG: penicillin-binding transpeptidase domain-containing protein [Sulfuricurvum sp.]|uniref:penicillin-binding transpeptidase domain-containing protein n=1 Tax=Sulfuricurvum sp. TaxID=2025608 RepID=UPI002609DB17|nr:penicillin-binding transpeptidase domain-containing protein [Sulfuricurvum sp.]MDD2950802.1 penicillin-binding transpeptidase domain-containing protein [Sulfuricurvum sp.]MDD5117844.1 penicillin-binding transpeptidase domain-containing protein [Sulfuricurvum sp.]